MAADLTTTEDAVLPVPARPATPPARPAARPHRVRFMLIYGLLGAVFVFGLVGIVIWAGRTINPAPAWSAWKPSGGGLGAAKQIAAHVGATYHLPGGTQLVDVFATAPSVAAGKQELPIHFISVRKGRAVSHVLVDSSNSLQYSFCGLGVACSITPGKPTVERRALLQREALELALYTFKYVGRFQHIIVLLPAKVGKPPTVAIYLQKTDLSHQLKVPLARTLSPRVPLPSSIGIGEEQTILALTNPRTYHFILSQAETGEMILGLSRKS